MNEKELAALKYVVERINGNENAEYIFDGDFNDKNKEIGMYIKKFLAEGLITTDKDKWTVNGGNTYNKYKNNIIMIHYDFLNFTNKAKMIIEYEDKSKLGKVFYKMKKSTSKFIYDTIIETRKQFIKYVVGVIGFIVFSLIGYKILEWIMNINK
jgi:hypothetical protein